MSKKGKKSAVSLTKKSITSDAEPWIKDTKIKSINDTEFQCSFSIVVEAKPFYRRLMREFDKFSKFGYRQCIKSISVDSIKETVFKHCSRNGEVNPFSILCDEILKNTGKFFDNKIPLDLFKYLIKYIVLELKENRIIEKKLKELNDLEYENKLRPYMNTVAKSGAKNSKKESAKGNKDTKNPLTAQEKVNTELHRRDTNVRCLPNIPDELENGLDLYIILIQSQHSELPMALIELDIPVRSLIQVGLLDSKSFDDDNSFTELLLNNLNTNVDIENVLKQSYMEKNNPEMSFIQEMDIRTFWNKILYYMNRKSYSGYFKNVDILSYSPEIPNDPKSPKFIETIQKTMYDGLSNIVFRSVELRRMHDLHIEQHTVKLATKRIAHLSDFKHYQAVMRNLTQEVSTVALVLDSLVSQVCMDSNSSVGYDIENYKFLNKTDRKSEKNESRSCLYKLIEGLEYDNRFSDINLSSLRNIEETDDKNNEPEIKVYYDGDEISEKLENLDEEIKKFAHSRNMHILKLFWDARIWAKIDESILLSDFKNKCSDNNIECLKHEMFDILVCLTELFNRERMEKIDQHFYIYKNENYENYLENLLDNIHKENYTISMQDKKSVLDLMPTPVTLQTLEKAMEFSSHCKIFFVPINNKTVIIFSDIKIPLKYKVDLPTILPLRDYINEMSKENKFDTWGIFKGKKRFNYSEMLYNKMMSQSLLNCMEKSQSDIICNPTKYHGDAEEWIQSNYDDILEAHCKKKYFDVYEPNESNNYGKDPLMKPILYDVGNKSKIEFSFFDMNINLNENTRLSLKYLEENDSETYHLSVLTKMEGHILYYKTNVLPEGYPLEPTDKRRSDFFIRHESGIILSFKKSPTKSRTSFNRYNYPNLNFLKFPSRQRLIEMDSNDSVLSPGFELNVSWPNGLIIRHIRKNGQTHYFRQEYLNKNTKKKSDTISNESFRCNINNGSVIKFMSNGHLIILHANGKVITCTEFEKQTDRPPQPVKTSKKFMESHNGSTLQTQEIEIMNIIDYEVRHSDGSVSWINEKIAREKEPLFSEDIHDVLECSITTEFSDGIIYKHESDGSLTINFLDGTVITTYSQFSEDVIEPEISEFEYDDEDLKPEPYTVIELTYKIDHPDYATTVYSFCKNSSILTMPNKIQITFSDNININFNESIEIVNFGKLINVKQAEQNLVQTEINYSFAEFGDRNKTEEPCVRVRDINKNSVLVFDNGKFEVHDDEPIGQISNQRLFIIDRDYDGFEILSRHQMNAYFKAPDNKLNCVLREIKSERFIDHVWMSPRYSIEQDFLLKKKVVTEPSTFGNQWYFPFKITDRAPQSLPQAVSIRYFKEMINITALIQELKLILLAFQNDYSATDINNNLNSNFNELLLPIKKMIQDPAFTWDNYKKGTYMLESPCTKRESEKYIKRILLYETAQKIFQSRLERIRIQFHSDKNKILSGCIEPYFDSPEGEVSLIINRVIDDMYKLIDEKNNERELQQLLFKPLCEISDNDLKRVEELLISTNSLNGEIQINSLQKLLEAGKNLQKYFVNINEVLECHKKIKSEDIKPC